MAVKLYHKVASSRRHIKTYIICILCSIIATSYAQEAQLTGSTVKCSPYMHTLHISPKHKSIPTAIHCTDSHTMAQKLRHDGYHATIVSPSLITTTAPLPYLKKLEQEASVKYIDAGRKASPTVERARELTNTNAIHEGIGLDTPYTGRGVIIGVIDSGIEYTHRLFSDTQGRSRVLCVWDHSGYGDSIFNSPTTTIPYAGDTITHNGHGTHVAGICAGSHIPGTNIWGIAPDASLLFVSTEYYLPEILEEVKFVSDFAKERGMPWVVNASFGLATGPHDGTDIYSRAVDSLVADGFGHQLVCSAGNRYNKRQHSSHTFTAQTDTVRLLTIPGTEGTEIDIWCQAGDSLPHLGYRPFIMEHGHIEYMDSTALSLYCQQQIAPFNRKHNIYINVPRDSLGHAPQTGVELWSDTPTTIHCWTGENSGTVTQPDSSYMAIDPNNTLDDMFATCRNVIAVGAYVSSSEYTRIDGINRTVANGPIGAPCLFSSRGPSITGIMQPTVSAPGSVLESGISSISDPQAATRTTTTRVVEVDGTKYYFGVKQGTSMSTPVVSGIVALWLEANPNLPASAIADIIKSTATKDIHTGSEEWNGATGYGKIDAYAGLKMALARSEADGIPTTRGNTPMLTLKRQGCQIVILTGNAESEMDISIHHANGTTAFAKHYGAMAKGSEVCVPLTSLPKGIYLLRIRTSGGQICRKITI